MVNINFDVTVLKFRKIQNKNNFGIKFVLLDVEMKIEKIMKQLIFLIGMLLFFMACSTQKGVVTIEPNNDEVAVEDSVEYQLIVFDAKFETWYMMHNNPSQYRSQSYYENWNQRYVAAWNYNASTMQRGNFFEPIVGYESTEDYGFELNHKLFYYFQYVERVLKIEIMPDGPRNIAL